MAKTKTTPAAYDPPITLESNRQRDAWHHYSAGLGHLADRDEAHAALLAGQPAADWLDAVHALNGYLERELEALVALGAIGTLLALDLALTAAGQPDPARLTWLLRWARFDGDDQVTRQQVAEVSGASLVTVQRWATSTDAPQVTGRAVEGGGALTYRAGDWAAWTPPATGRPGGQR